MLSSADSGDDLSDSSMSELHSKTPPETYFVTPARLAGLTLGTWKYRVPCTGGTLVYKRSDNSVAQCTPNTPFVVLTPSRSPQLQSGEVMIKPIASPLLCFYKS